MTQELRIDLSDLRRTWQKRRALVAEVRRRIDPTGMTRPPRTEEERRWLAEQGIVDPFTEVHEYAEAYRAYFEAKYGARP
jgi:hypothetical protein